MDKSGYQAIVYRQAEGPWVAEVPGLSGCHAMMPTKEEALDELRRLFRTIAADCQR
jgi:predicted RNase H-like HicB family nuclease